MESYLPLYSERRKWSDRIKKTALVLFPNYVFVRRHPALRMVVSRAPGAVGLVTQGNEDGLVPEDEIAAIRRVLQCSIAAKPHHGMTPGEPVILEDGPLKGTAGYYMGEGKQGRLIVQVELLKRGLSIPVEHAWVRPLGSSLPAELQWVARRMRARGANASGAERP